MVDTHTERQPVLDIFNYSIMRPIFEIFEMTKGIQQMEIHHPEGDVFTHSVQSISWAFRESYDTDLILAALLHDVGKVQDSKGHDKIGAEWVKPYVSVKTAWLIEQHMRVWYLILGEMRKLSKVKDLAEHPWLPELILLARWDKLSRNPNKTINYSREDIMVRLNQKAVERFNREDKF